MDRNDGVNVLFSDEKSAFRIIWQFVDFEIWINKTNESLLIYSCLLIRMLKTAVSIYWLPVIRYHYLWNRSFIHSTHFTHQTKISMEIILKRFMNFVSTSKFSHHEMKVNMAALWVVHVNCTPYLNGAYNERIRIPQREILDK